MSAKEHFDTPQGNWEVVADWWNYGQIVWEEHAALALKRSLHTNIKTSPQRWSTVKGMSCFGAALLFSGSGQPSSRDEWIPKFVWVSTTLYWSFCSAPPMAVCRNINKSWSHNKQTFCHSDSWQTSVRSQKYLKKYNPLLEGFAVWPNHRITWRAENTQH